jgi:hypothetical protein
MKKYILLFISGVLLFTGKECLAGTITQLLPEIESDYTGANATATFSSPPFVSWGTANGCRGVWDSGTSTELVWGSMAYEELASTSPFTTWDLDSLNIFFSAGESFFWVGNANTTLCTTTKSYYEGLLNPIYYIQFHRNLNGSWTGGNTNWLSILNPAWDSYASTSFDFTIEYNTASTSYNKILIIAEMWNASSTCPEENTPEYQAEYNLGYFNYQSNPIYSQLLTSSTTATTTATAKDLKEGYYNCFRCIYYNTETLVYSSEKCRGYKLHVGGYLIPPGEYPTPVIPFADYFTAHSNPKFATPTEITTSIAGTFDGLYTIINTKLNNFRYLFDTTQADAMGAQFGNAIVQARGFVKIINDVFGGSLPLVQIILFELLVVASVPVIRITRHIAQLIRG